MRHFDVEKALARFGGSVGLRYELWAAGRPFPSLSNVSGWKNRGTVPSHWAAEIVMLALAKGWSIRRLISDREEKPEPKPAPQSISAERLRALVIYHPDTGELIATNARRKPAAGRKLGTRRHDGTTVLRIDGRVYLRSRLAFLWTEGRWPDHLVHINGDRSDDRWCNLRELSAKEMAARIHASRAANKEAADQEREDNEVDDLAQELAHRLLPHN